MHEIEFSFFSGYGGAAGGPNLQQEHTRMKQRFLLL